MVILLVAIDGYCIISYCWLLYVILWLLVIIYKLLLDILGYIIIGY